ncbi:MAG: molecular chaperone DnaK [Chloroflexi bacterium]|nr:molecular chaperone DnaK [Chloroflexota bacterium]MBM3172166.1 molecular chaperone DnaK [Chloroflexota bacterium]MBM3175824.1 molecular chaperone DnaK [Chloroflexota bacterium]MBM4449487.1 molecular chaperone DnaK [Chloroflexota bacterium]
MADVAELCAVLKKEQALLTRELEQLEAQMQSNSEGREGSPFGKREEGATETFELEKSLALERKLRTTLAEVNRALAKCEAGTYGICDACGKPIEPARLEALPQAGLCLSCKASQAKDGRGKLAR